MKQTPGDARVGTPRSARYPRFVLLALAFLLWVLVPVALLLPLSAAQRGWATAAPLVAGEVAFWVSAFVPGREVVRRYRANLDPRLLLRRGGS